jgi:diguanylate cyclase (GGDEF)-like protein/PAS domain S-box-containing protein
MTAACRHGYSLVMATQIDSVRWFERSNQLLCEANFYGQLTRVNGAWTRLLGYEKAELLGSPYLGLVHPWDRAETMALAQRLARSRHHQEALFRNRYRAKTGAWHWISWTVRSDAQRIYSAGRDVTEIVLEEEDRERQLSYAWDLAQTDPLTGLPNRRAWDDAIRRELARGSRHGHDISVAMLDLDRFKSYNDAHGHPAGDELLRASAQGWSVTLRETDLLARVGGEEFAVLLPACKPGPAFVAVERLRAATPRVTTCSAGLAHWNGGESADDLLARADAALYRAKRDGRNRTALGVEMPARPAR